MKILITGANGQLGKTFRQLSIIREDDFLFTDVEELDITNCEAVEEFFAENKPDFLVNCAAYTAVDKAETNEEMALLLNRDAVENLAEACKKHNCFFVHISTDYVFDGEKSSAYNEEDITNPQSVYGKSKLAGEAILARYNNVIIIRTAWLYSDFGNNFVATMVKLGKERDEIRVVCDQFGSPTYSKDLAEATLAAIDSLKNDKQQQNSCQIFHFSNEGRCSWYDFAAEIMNLANLDCKVVAISTSEYPTAAKRPKNSVLDKTKFKASFGISIAEWQQSLFNQIKNYE